MPPHSLQYAPTSNRVHFEFGISSLHGLMHESWPSSYLPFVINVGTLIFGAFETPLQSCVNDEQLSLWLRRAERDAP